MPASSSQPGASSQVSLAGPGLFAAQGAAVTVTRAGSGGVVFRRTDLPGAPAIPACATRVLARPRQTVLAHADHRGVPSPHPGEATVQTVEHLLSAMWAAGLRHARVDVEGPEIPLLDGSARGFLEAFERAGWTAGAGAEAGAGVRGGGSPGAGTLEAGVEPPLDVRTAVELTDGDALLRAEPLADRPASDASVPGGVRWRLELRYELIFPAGAPIRSQAFEFSLGPDAASLARYREQIAPARTFCTHEEAAALRSMGLFAHLAPGDVLVIGPEGPVGTSLRFEDEPVRHKVLDLIGDLALAARPIHARVLARRSGHALNHRLARALAEGRGG